MLPLACIAGLGEGGPRWPERIMPLESGIMPEFDSAQNVALCHDYATYKSTYNREMHINLHTFHYAWQVGGEIVGTRARFRHYLRALSPFLGASESPSFMARYGNPKFRIYKMRPIESRSLEIADGTESSLEMGNEIDRVAVTGNCRQY